MYLQLAFNPTFTYLMDQLIFQEITEKMIEMIGITCEEVQREIITCLPDVVEDTEHATVALALR